MTTTNRWVEELHEVMTRGELSRPRDQLTRELLGFKSSIEMTHPIIMSPSRKLGYRFMAAEAAWILSGDNRVSSIAPFSKEISRFSDDGVTFFGAYGPRIVDQLHYVAQAILKDPDTRQAVLTIWRDNPRDSKDVPCTVSVQWLVRDGCLHCIDMMRSSDMWLGHPYDITNFSLVSVALLLRLRRHGLELELGDLHLIAGSKHIYERNFEAVEKVIQEELQNPAPECFKIDPDVFDDEDDLVDRLWTMAEAKEGILEEPLWR